MQNTDTQGTYKLTTEDIRDVLDALLSAREETSINLQVEKFLLAFDKWLDWNKTHQLAELKSSAPSVEVYLTMVNSLLVFAKELEAAAVSPEQKLSLSAKVGELEAGIVHINNLTPVVPGQAEVEPDIQVAPALITAEEIEKFIPKLDLVGIYSENEDDRRYSAVINSMCFDLGLFPEKEEDMVQTTKILQSMCVPVKVGPKDEDVEFSFPPELSEKYSKMPYIQHMATAVRAHSMRKVQAEQQRVYDSMSKGQKRKLFKKYRSEGNVARKKKVREIFQDKNGATFERRENGQVIKIRDEEGKLIK